MFIHIDYVTVGVAALAYYLIGWLWYSTLFSALWQSEMKALKRVSKITPATAMATKAAWSLVTAFVLYVLMDNVGVTDAFEGIRMGLFIWLGTAFANQLDNFLFENQSQNLLLINAGYDAVSYAVMGAIIGYML